MDGESLSSIFGRGMSWKSNIRAASVSGRNIRLENNIQVARVPVSSIMLSISKAVSDKNRRFETYTQSSREPTVYGQNRCLENNTQVARMPAPPILSYTANVKKRLILHQRKFDHFVTEKSFQIKRTCCSCKALPKASPSIGAMPPTLSYAANVKKRLIWGKGESKNNQVRVSRSINSAVEWRK